MSLTSAPPDTIDGSSRKTYVNYLGRTWHDVHYTFIPSPDKPSFDDDILPKDNSSSLGDLDVLPIEVQHMILENLDLRSLENLESLNSGSKALVSSLPAYRDIRNHAPEIPWVLTATSMLSKFTPPQIHDVLCTDRCSSCNNVGSFVFLPTFSRCCLPCAKSNPDLRAMEASMAKICYGLTKRQLNSLGTVSFKDTCYRSPRYLVSIREARDLGIARHGSVEKMQRFVAKRYSHNERTLRGGRIIPGRTITDPYLAGNTRRRFPSEDLRNLTITGCPYINRKAQQPQERYFCAGCEIDWVGPIGGRESIPISPFPFSPFPSVDVADVLRERMFTGYSEDEFIEHYKTCQPAKFLWASHLVGRNYLD